VRTIIYDICLLQNSCQSATEQYGVYRVSGCGTWSADHTIFWIQRL